jgi:hypothetical protein
MLRKAFAATLLVTTLFAGLAVIQAQSDDKKFEIGAQGSVLRVPARTFSTAGATITFNEEQKNDWGFGGRVGYNFSRNLGIEAEGNFFPRDRAVDGGRKLQGLFGAKVGQRFEKGGVFLKARPGFVRFSRGQYQFSSGGCPTVFPPPIGCFQPQATNNLAFDLGGVGEVYPSKNTIIRFDAGDTMIRFKAQRQVVAVDPTTGGLVVLPAAAETKHNFQASFGFGYRF